MSDRDKVIKGLEHCHNRCFCDEGCPYHHILIDPNRGIDECTSQLAQDALALLKEHEPRVLTLEEVQNDCPDYVYLETTSGWFECCIKDEGESDTYLGDFAYGIDEYFIKRWREYGTTWRCWTSRPTGGQRKAVKWDE